MTFLRRIFAKHFCPKCGRQVHREKLPVVERLLQEWLLFIPAAFFFIVFGGIMQHFGFVSGIAAWTLAVLFTFLILGPLLYRYVRYSCTHCGNVASFNETV